MLGDYTRYTCFFTFAHVCPSLKTNAYSFPLVRFAKRWFWLLITMKTEEFLHTFIRSIQMNWVAVNKYSRSVREISSKMTMKDTT